MPLIRETVERLFRRVKTNKLSKNLIVLPLFTSIFSISMISSLNNEESASDQTVKANFETPALFAEDVKVSQIVPGDSSLQRDAAEKARIEAIEKEKQAKIVRTRQVVSRERRVYNDPTEFGSIYESAGSMFGVDPALLKAIHMIETGASGSTSRSSYMGATGPMQFLPSTFNRHAIDGNGDGIKDVSNVHDAIFTAAEYLRACGYPDLRKALWGYNPSQSYYNKVINLANQFGLK